VILYGRNAVREALRGRRAHSVGEVWATQSTAREPWLAGVQVRTGTAADIERLCGSSAHQGVCAQAGGYPYVSAEELLVGSKSPAGSKTGSDAAREPLIVALDEIQDPQNLGSIARTAECAGCSGVAIPQRRSAEVTPAACKASAGALEHLRVARVRNLADFLVQAREAGCWCYGASAQAAGKRAPIPYDAPDYRGAGVVLVLGSEGRGLRPRVATACDELIALPLRGRVGSLGVSAAAAAVLYEILQNRDRAP
jgi:23S rRNA (guanosine2251-2'-O)-methyltransferase